MNKQQKIFKKQNPLILYVSESFFFFFLMTKTKKLHKKFFFFWFVFSGRHLPTVPNYKWGEKPINNLRVKIKEFFKQSTL